MDRKLFNSKSLKTALFSLFTIALASSTAVGSQRALVIPGDRLINVNVSLNMQVPLASDDQESLAAAQKEGRKMIYNLAVTECPILQQTIAATCVLKSLNVSTQIRSQNNTAALSLYLNGSAQFSITLKGDAAQDQ